MASRSAHLVLGLSSTQKISKFMTAQGSGEVTVEVDARWPPRMLMWLAFFLSPSAGSTPVRTLSLTRLRFCITRAAHANQRVFPCSTHGQRASHATLGAAQVGGHPVLRSEASDVSSDAFLKQRQEIQRCNVHCHFSISLHSTDHT